MFRLTGSALALIMAFSLAPLAHGEAGVRSEGKRIVKQQKIRMLDGSHRNNRRYVRRIVDRSVVVLNFNGGKNQQIRHRGSRDTYSGDVMIDVRDGVGRWSYGGYDAGVAAVRTVPNAKVIDVDAMKFDSVCEMQAGVCVIRP